MSSGNFGTARFGSWADIIRDGMIGKGDGGWFMGRTGYLSPPTLGQAVRALLSPMKSELAVRQFLLALFGSRCSGDDFIRIHDGVHGLVCAPAGAGKTTMVLGPNLLSYPGNCVVVDAKGGELYELTAEHRRKQFGHTIVRLDPALLFGPGANRFNPIDFIDANADDFIDRCRDLANQIVVRTGSEPEPFWADSAEALLCGFLAHVCASEPKRELRNLRNMRSLIASRERYTLALQEMQSSEDVQVLQQLGHQLAWHVDKQLAGVMGNAQRHTDVFDAPLIVESTCGTDPYDLLLMSSAEGARGNATKRKNLILVATIRGTLHFRIFDRDGRLVVDTDETKLAAQAGPIEELRKQLEGLWPPHDPTGSEKAEVIDAVKSIVGYSPPCTDWDPAALRTGRMTVYLIVPPDRLVVWGGWLRMTLGSILRIITRGKPTETNPVLFLVDEAAHIGRMQVVEDAITLMRGMGIRMWLFFQSLDQLNRCFGDHASTVLDNLGTQLYFGINSYETAEALSKRIGDYTLCNETVGSNSGYSLSSGVRADGSSSNRGSNVSYTELAAKLVKPEEILLAGESEGLLFHRNHSVIRLQMINYFSDPAFRRRGRRGWGTGRSRGLGPGEMALALTILAVSCYAMRLVNHLLAPVWHRPGVMAPRGFDYGGQRGISASGYGTDPMARPAEPEQRPAVQPPRPGRRRQQTDGPSLPSGRRRQSASN